MPQSEKIRVLYLIDSLGMGGSQTDLVNVCRYIDKSQFELNVWALHNLFDVALTLGFRKLLATLHNMSK